MELHNKCLDKTTQPTVPTAAFGIETGEWPCYQRTAGVCRYETESFNSQLKRNHWSWEEQQNWVGSFVSLGTNDIRWLLFKHTPPQPCNYFSILGGESQDCVLPGRSDILSHMSHPHCICMRTWTWGWQVVGCAAEIPVSFFGARDPWFKLLFLNCFEKDASHSLMLLSKINRKRNK